MGATVESKRESKRLHGFMGCISKQAMNKSSFYGPSFLRKKNLCSVTRVARHTNMDRADVTCITGHTERQRIVIDLINIYVGNLGAFYMAEWQERGLAKRAAIIS